MVPGTGSFTAMLKKTWTGRRFKGGRKRFHEFIVSKV